MGKRFSDDEREFLSRLLDSEDAEEDAAEEADEEPAAEEEEADEFTYRGKRYRAVADEPEPAKKAAPTKKAAPKKAAADPEPDAPKRRRFVS